MTGEKAYLSRRAQEERQAATHAAHPTAKRAHLALAIAYECRIAALALDEPEAEAWRHQSGVTLAGAAPVAPG